MNDAEIALVQDSFTKLLPMKFSVAMTFYEELFLLDPSLRKLFSDDMRAQYIKLIDTLAYVVKGLKYFDEMDDKIAELAIRHVHYGVRPEHYDVVAEALLKTLASGLGDDWDEELEYAWTKAYSMIAFKMKTAAYGERVWLVKG